MNVCTGSKLAYMSKARNSHWFKKSSCSSWPHWELPPIPKYMNSVTLLWACFRIDSLSAASPSMFTGGGGGSVCTLLVSVVQPSTFPASGPCSALGPSTPVASGSVSCCSGGKSAAGYQCAEYWDFPQSPQQFRYWALQSPSVIVMSPFWNHRYTSVAPPHPRNRLWPGDVVPTSWCCSIGTRSQCSTVPLL